MGTRLYITAPNRIIELILDVPSGSVDEYRAFETKAEDFKLKGDDSEFAGMFPEDLTSSDPSWRIFQAEANNPVFETLSHFYTYGFGKLNEAQHSYIRAKNLGDMYSGNTNVAEYISSLICLHNTHINMSAKTWGAIETAYWC